MLPRSLCIQDFDRPDCKNSCNGQVPPILCIPLQRSSYCWCRQLSSDSPTVLRLNHLPLLFFVLKISEINVTQKLLRKDLRIEWKGVGTNASTSPAPNPKTKKCNLLTIDFQRITS